MENSDPIKKQIELNSLIEFSQLINSNLDLDFVFGNILLSIMGKMMITKGLFLVKNHNKGENVFIIKTVKGLSQNYKNKEIEYAFPRLSIFNSEDFKDKDNFFTKNSFNFFFKIYFTNKLLGVLCLGKKISNDIITKEETIFIETMLNISAPAIENSLKFNEIKVLNSDLSTQINQLKSLFELSKELNSNFQDRDKIIKLLNYTLLGNFGVKDLLIFSKFRSEKFYLLNYKKDLYVDDELLNSLEEITEPVLTNENSNNYCVNFLNKQNYKLLFPIKNNGKVDSIVCLGSKLSKKDFSSEDLQFLESILNLSVISLDNTILFNEYIEKQKIENELMIAREMQVALLPKELPLVNNYRISAVNIPAMQVGGDYYDIIKLSDTKFAFAIADVSGKGTPASLLMSNIQSAIHSFLKLYDENTFDLSDVTEKINELIYENTTVEKFITFFWGILDSEKHTFTYINAGHNPPLHISDNIVTLLDKGGLMLGVLGKDVLYESGEIYLDENDIILFYTDGVTEAVNNNNEEFGEERLHKTTIAHSDKSPDKILNIINKEIELFAKGLSQHDDITLIVLKKNN
ncbi:MAG: SpoIIE family protein phosphatase [Ignavibacteria bacterium]|jgi:sigma-B regulation protein RsbU (phosphoserine phosphatase)